METEIIVLFCIVDDYLKAINFTDDKQSTLSTAEIITIAISAAYFFGGNHDKTRIFFKEHRYVYRMLSKSQFSRRLHAIDQHIWEQLFYIFAETFKEMNQNAEYIVDSFPISVCHNIRIDRSAIYQGEEYRGYSASKRQYFYGIRVHLISTIKGGPVEFIIAPGAANDAKIFKQFNFNLPDGSTIFGDSIYTDYEHEELLRESINIKLLPARKSNSKRPHPPYVAAFIDLMRKNIETTFSVITNLFPKKIHAINSKGFELKIIFYSSQSIKHGELGFFCRSKVISSYSRAKYMYTFPAVF